MLTKTLKSVYIYKKDVDKSMVIFTDGCKSYYARNIPAQNVYEDNVYDLSVKCSKSLLPNTYDIILNEILAIR